MANVLRIINRFNLGGISYNVSYLSKYLSESYQTLLIGGPEEAGEESSLYIPHSLGLKPKIIESMRRSINPLSDYFAYLEIKKIIREFKPDIVHTHASKAGAIGRLAAIHCKVPVIVHTFHGHVFHGYFGSFKTGIFKTIERYLARRSHAIIAISEAQKKELSERYHICEAEKIHVIPLGFDLKRFTEHQEEKRNIFRKKYQVMPDELAIGIIGRLAPIKNHYLFIDAFHDLLKAGIRHVKGFIIGDGETKEALIAYVKELNIPILTEDMTGYGICFTSWIKEVDVALAGIDLVCLSSKNEGTPVSLIEAQAAGKFIISTEVGGIKDILHPACGMLSAESDAQAFTENLMDAVKRFDTLKKQAGQAREDVLRKFHYTRLCHEMEQLYDALRNVNQGGTQFRHA